MRSDRILAARQKKRETLDKDSFDGLWPYGGARAVLEELSVLALWSEGL